MLIRVSNISRHFRRYFGTSAELWKLYPVSERLQAPPHIARPSYAQSNFDPSKRTIYKNIYIHNPSEIEKMRKVSEFASQIRSFAGSLCQIGRTTDEIDVMVHNKIIEHDFYPSPLNYHGFPKSCCTSVNQVICHGIPDARPLEDGDIIKIDISIFRDHHHGDCCGTFFVGNPSKELRQLERVTMECLELGISVCKPNQPFKLIGHTIESHAEKYGYSTVDTLFGHGIGRELHMPPFVLHHRNEGTDIMRPGMIFTIEPMICQGTKSNFTMEDNWTIVTRDQKRAAQWEQTVLITETGCEILTAHKKELHT